MGLGDSTGESWITDLWKNIKRGVSSAWNWLKSNWKKCVDWVANIAGGASSLAGILSLPAVGLLSIPVAGQIALGIVGIACFIWTTIRLLGF